MNACCRIPSFKGMHSILKLAFQSPRPSYLAVSSGYWQCSRGTTGLQQQAPLLNKPSLSAVFGVSNSVLTWPTLLAWDFKTAYIVHASLNLSTPLPSSVVSYENTGRPWICLSMLLPSRFSWITQAFCCLKYNFWASAKDASEALSVPLSPPHPYIGGVSQTKSNVILYSFFHIPNIQPVFTFCDSC